MSLPEPQARRILRLREVLAERGLDAALVVWPPHVRYFSGIESPWSPALLLVDQERVTAVVASSETAVAPGFDLVPYGDMDGEGAAPPLQSALARVSRVARESGIPSSGLGIERERIALAGIDAFPGLELAPSLDEAIAHLRMRKDAAEIDQIRGNLRVLAAGFAAARAAIAPGATELSIWAAAHDAMMTAADSPFPLEGNFASGPRTLENEPQATNRRVEAGDVLFIDLYPNINGYTADLTRTFTVGAPTAAQRARHAVLVDALAAGAAALKPGVRARDVDGVVRASVAAALGGYTFPHHAGHALGMEGQERPLLLPHDETLIEPGMVIAIEPGAYLPDVGGMRVEGNYLVTEIGCVSLSDYPIELFACN